MTHALRQDQAELSQLRPQHVDCLGALTNKQITCSVNAQDSLLFLCLHLNETHCRACHRFADSGGINRI
jgi:hypothetical protein